MSTKKDALTDKVLTYIQKNGSCSARIVAKTFYAADKIKDPLHKNKVIKRAHNLLYYLRREGYIINKEKGCWILKNQDMRKGHIVNKEKGPEVLYYEETGYGQTLYPPSADPSIRIKRIMKEEGSVTNSEGHEVLRYEGPKNPESFESQKNINPEDDKIQWSKYHQEGTNGVPHRNRLEILDQEKLPNELTEVRSLIKNLETKINAICESNNHNSLTLENRISTNKKYFQTIIDNLENSNMNLSKEVRKNKSNFYYLMFFVITTLIALCIYMYLRWMPEHVLFAH